MINGILCLLSRMADRAAVGPANRAATRQADLRPKLCVGVAVLTGLTLRFVPMSWSVWIVLVIFLLGTVYASLFLSEAEPEDEDRGNGKGSYPTQPVV